MKLAFVAFLDILGFSEIVLADSSCPEPGSQSLSKLRAALASIPQADGSVQLVQFSDCIVVSSAFEASCERLAEFLHYVRELQASLFGQGFLIRGGISHGQHYQEQGVLYSQGLIEAYRLESTKAIGPRVIVSSDLIELIDPSNKYDFELLMDRDGHLFLNYLARCEPSHAAAFIDRSIDNFKQLPESAQKKWIWLQDYASAVLPDGSVKTPKMISKRYAG